MKLTKETIERLTKKHIQRYTNRLIMARHGDPRYREDELHHYLLLWESIQAKDHELLKLTREEQEELLDAAQDEDE